MKTTSAAELAADEKRQRDRAAEHRTRSATFSAKAAEADRELTALLAERGLDGALGALVLTAGLPVTVDVDRCDDLPVEMQRAVWFTASEAVTNALKHAHASRLRVSLRRTTTDLTVTIADNGRGGLASPPASLSRRVADGGGALHVESNGTGTLVSATFPLLAGAHA